MWFEPISSLHFPALPNVNKEVGGEYQLYSPPKYFAGEYKLLLIQCKPIKSFELRQAYNKKMYFYSLLLYVLNIWWSTHNLASTKYQSSYEFFTIGVSVRLSDRSLHREEQKKKFIKNCPQWGLKPGPADLQANALPTELGRNLLGRRFLKWALFVSHTTSHVGLCPFLESIEHDFIKAMKIQQVTECWLSSVGKVLAWRSGGPGSTPQGAIFDEFFLPFPV